MNCPDNMKDKENTDESPDGEVQIKDPGMPEEEMREAGEMDSEMPETEPGPEQEFQPIYLPSDVYAISQVFISLLGTSAWQHLGLVPDPKTQEIKVDLKQAQIAIDIITFLFDKIEDGLEEKQTKEIRDILANLRINFVQRSGEGQKEG